MDNGLFAMLRVLSAFFAMVFQGAIDFVAFFALGDQPIMTGFIDGTT